MIFPFHTSPQVFELTIPGNLENLKFEYFESDYGLTDELLCYFNNILIGRVLADARILVSNSRSLYLLPALEQTRKYSWSNRQEFTQALVKLLSQPISWILHCEFDVDQRPVQKIENDLSTTILELEKALEYCARESFDCPSFIASQRIT